MPSKKFILILVVATTFLGLFSLSSEKALANGYPLPDFELPYYNVYTEAEGKPKWTGGPHQWGKDPSVAMMDMYSGSGLDFARGGKSFTVAAMAEGDVIWASNTYYGALGICVGIKHTVGGSVLLYCHLESIWQPILDAMAAGQGYHVQPGYTLGYAGDTGSGADSIHLHLELRDGTRDCCGSGKDGGNPITWHSKRIGDYMIFNYRPYELSEKAYNYDGIAIRLYPNSSGPYPITSFSYYDDLGGGNRPLRSPVYTWVPAGYECNIVNCEMVEHPDVQYAAHGDLTGGGGVLETDNLPPDNQPQPGDPPPEGTPTPESPPNPMPGWLQEFSIAATTSVRVEIYTRVDAVPGVYAAHRVLAAGSVIGETAAGDQTILWTPSGLSSGYHTIRVEYRKSTDPPDWSGVEYYEIEYYVTTETTPPETSANYSIPDGNSGWHVSPVNVQLNAYDESGVAHTYYRINGVQHEGTTFSIPDDGIYSICYWSVDTFGNVESEKCIEVKIDQTPPVTDGTVTAPRDMHGIFRDTVNSDIVSTDDLSGVAYTECSVDNGQTWTTLGDMPSFTGTGVYQFFCRSEDNAGNVSEVLDSGPIVIYMEIVTNKGPTGLTLDGNTGLFIHGEGYSNGPLTIIYNTNTHMFGTLKVANNAGSTFYGNTNMTLQTQAVSGFETISYPFDYYWSRCDSYYPDGLTLYDVGQHMEGVVCVNGDLIVYTVNVTADLTFVVNGNVDFWPTCGWFHSSDPDNGMLMYATGDIVQGGNCYDFLGMVMAGGTVSNQSTDTITRGSYVASHLEFKYATDVEVYYDASFTAGSFDLPLDNASFADPVPGPPDPEATPVPTTTPQPTATTTATSVLPTATPTSQPTNTPLPTATNTPQPTVAPTATPQPTPTTQPGSADNFYFSLTSSETLGGVDIDDEDIVVYDFNTQTYELIWDDDVWGNSRGFSGLEVLSDNEILISPEGYEDLPGISGYVRPEDIAKCNLSTHTCEMYFNGADVGLNDDINGFSLMPDGSILMALDWGWEIGSLEGDATDVVKFNPVSLGTSTAGNFNLFFDGSDVGLDEDIGSIWFNPTNSALCMSFTSTFYAPSGVTARDEDVLCFNGTSYGTNTSGTFASSLKLDFSTLGNTEELNGIHFTQ